MVAIAGGERRLLNMNYAVSWCNQRLTDYEQRCISANLCFCSSVKFARLMIDRPGLQKWTIGNFRSSCTAYVKSVEIKAIEHKSQ